MSKKKNINKPNQTRHVTQEMSPPQVVDMEALAYISDGDLERRHAHLVEEMNKAFHSGYETYLWEVELAYVQREAGVRRTRKLAHDRYVRSNPDFYVNVDYSDSSESSNYIN